MVMAMRHGALPKTLNLDRPSADVDWTAGEVELLGEPLPWPKAPGRPRRAAVSSFGISGTNAHLVLEEAPAPDRSAAPSGPARSSLPLLLSAKSETALRAQAERLAGHLRANPSLDSLDVAFSLAGRAQLGHRAVVVGERPDVLANLSALAAGEGAPGLVEGAALRRRETAFVFPGQGSQWVGMGLRLWRSSPCFAERMRACDAALSEFVDWSLEEVLNDAEALERVDVVQPALFAVMVSLASLWSSHGVQPAVVIGHSQGEIAAAHVAGALSLLDAARVVALRSQAIAGIAGRGGMVSVAANEEWVAESIAAEAGLAVAAVNAPTAVVVAGEREALERLLVACEDGGVRARKIAVDYASHTAQVEAIGERLLADLAPIAPRHEEVPIFSTATGARIDGRELDAEYWNRSLRNPVRFADATASLAAEGIDAFIEVSPHPVLTTAIEETAAVTALGTLRRGELDSERFMLSLAAAHANGIEVDWSPLLGAGRLADLPSYPFQRQRYWLGPGDGADLSTAGMTAVDHPLLAAVFPLAGEDRHLLSGRISLDEHPWLADHTVLDSMLLPGTAFVELAVAAGRQVGSETVEELTLEAPLQLPPTGGVPIQIVLGEEEKSSRRREVAIYSRPEDGSEWVRHASGVLIEADPLDAEAPASWPPEGAEPVDVDLLYERLGERGIHYGPAFRRLRAAWRRGKEAFAEVVLDDCQGSERFALHPALADAALHPVLSLGEEASGVADLPLPFSWHDVRLGSEAGARALRVRIAVDPKGAIELAGFTEDGSLAFSVGALRTRALDPERLSSGNRRAAKASLLALEWVPTQPLGGAEAKLAVLGDSEIHATERHADLEAAAIAVEAGKAMIETIAVEVGATADPHEAGGRALALLRKFLADERLASCRLAFVTRGAVAAGQADEVAAPGSAALWGLVRSAQSEHPGRFALVDLDRDDASVAALPQALANEEETQLALRAGRALAPRLTRVTRTNGESSIDPDGTVLITGGTGVLGRRLAAHLVRGHGARHLLLASRRGADAEGLAELAELDCEIAIETCDVSDREQLEALLDGIPVERPLTAVVHAAGVLDDGTVDSLTPERLDAVLAPKAGAAWHLDELTREMDLDAFVLFSSLTGTLGGAGQANYAAASASLDALAGHRRARGLPAISLAWGLWEEASGMTRKLNDADLARLAREGVAPLPTERALRLLDTALAAEDALLFPVCLDLAALRARARSGLLPPLLEKLAPAPADQRAATLERALAGRLAALPEEKREPLLLELVRREVATVLGHASPGAVDPGRAFKELGFDSLTAVDLRNRLNRVTGLSLSATLAFDYPTPRAVAGKIRIDFEGGNPPKPAVTSNHEQAARDAAEERVLRDIDGLDLAGLVERSLNEARS
jgi:acyl transferase domain-containing protein